MIRTPVMVGLAGLVLLAGSVAATSGSSPSWTPAAGQRVPVQTDEQPQAQVVNDEVVVARLDPTGLPEHAVLLSRVTVDGPQRRLVDPASGANVRFLDRLGRPQVSPDGVVLEVGGDRPQALTEARLDKPLPVALHAQYTVDGQVVPAADIPGASGEITVTYTLANTTAEQTELTFEDAAGQPQESEQPVFVPFQGNLTATLPDDTNLVGAPGAMLATDELGRTIVRWSISLYPPISTPIQELVLTMRTQDAGVPSAQVLLTPAGADQDPATGFSTDLLSGSTQGNADLYDGLEALDSATSALAEGSDQLAAGLSSLAGGADEALAASSSLSQGVDDLAQGADSVAGASDTLATGVVGLADGADDVATGSRQLASELGDAATGAQDLAEATAQLAQATSGSPAEELAPMVEGGQQIEAGLRQVAQRIGSPSDPVLDLTTPVPPDGDDTCPPGGTAPPDDDCVTIYQGVRALRDGLRVVHDVASGLEARVEQALGALEALIGDVDSIGADVTQASAGADGLYESLCTGTAPELDPDSCAQLLAVAEAADSALSTASDNLPDVEELPVSIAALGKQAGAVCTVLDKALESTERLLLGVGAVGLAVGTGTPDQPGPATAMAALNAGLEQLAGQLNASQAELNDALLELAAGSQDLAAGIDRAADGAAALADGSALVAGGARTTASGANTLAQGSQELAIGARDAASGADRLSTGLGGLAGGADSAASAGADLAGGAWALQYEGIEPTAAGLLDASSQAALAEAWLEASAARAQDALPYGPPVGARGNVAYVFTMAEVPAPTSFWERIRAMFGG